MGIEERKQRNREATRTNILKASLTIVIKDGWQALSMRKIGEIIEYSAPVIYEYFSNKEAILIELARRGYVSLNQQVSKARQREMLPEDQLENMCMAYWEFAVTNKELYQLMFGVDMQSCCPEKLAFETGQSALLIRTVIEQLILQQEPDNDTIEAKHLMCWCSIHGLVSLNLLQKADNHIFNKQVLRMFIKCIINSLKS
ncbi:TetR/AcrR family transcriptional regulator [Mucilaginibacter ginsenosidivorax]|uniref:TetR/AcrR family transcriptional regulator n=1 Tax=Mucilaginibacter ginsenosidivorax TaxID=862126 RepID=A0A5B8W395_9SPHI|nr:TetR/AcrR family transcriptional regulator [Mucilaginibacter ginsenosidivorax]QEC78530.1 TetR/AcrR family transcriptional regulator [Mucilaginibacter ginsenosidivorax]